MPQVSSSPLPRSVTAGQLAQILRVTERSVMGRKMAGRLPVAPDGRIDLHAIIRAGVNALLGERLAIGPEAGEAYDRTLCIAASATAHLMLTRIMAAEPGADLGTVAAGALREALTLFGIGEVEDAPIPDRLEPLASVA